MVVTKKYVLFIFYIFSVTNSGELKLCGNRKGIRTSIHVLPSNVYSCDFVYTYRLIVFEKTNTYTIYHIAAINNFGSFSFNNNPCGAKSQPKLC